MTPNNIRKLREERKLSQFDLAIKSHTPQSLLSMLEHGRIQPWPAVKRRLAAALDVPESELFPSEKEPCASKR